jgi:plasmid stabilization system protein ParE
VSKPVRLDPEAEAEVWAEIRWYENESAGLGQRLWDEIQNAIDLISAHPTLGGIVPRLRSVDPPPRRLRVRHFPLYVVYRDFADEIELVALAPMSRKPGYWRSRTF